VGNFGGRVISDTAAANSIVAAVSGAAIAATRAVKSNAQGTVDIITATGETIVGYQLEQGYNPISVTKLTFNGTLVAANVFALY
jgi:hypothetical protein